MLDKNKLSSYFYPAFFIFNLWIAAGIRLRHWMPQRLWPDEALYAWLAKRISETPSLIFSPEITSFHPPLFSTLLSLGHAFLPGEAACRFIVLAINLIGILGIYILGKSVFNSFVGLIASIFLSFNYIYLSQSNLILIDGPLTVFYIFLALFLFKSVTDDRPLYKWITGGWLACIIWLKWSGLVAVAFALAYYLCVPKQNISRAKQITIPLGLSLTAVAVLFILNIKPETSALSGQYFVHPFWYYAQNLNPFVAPKAVLLLAAIGLLALRKFKSPQKYLLGLWIIIPFILASLAAEKVPRYILPVVPPVMLLSALGINYVLSFIKNQDRLKYIKFLTVIVCFAGYFSSAPFLERSLAQNGLGYAGFKQAGEWIKKNADADITVLAGSKRAIRYYSQINYEEFGGRLRPIPESLQDLQKLTKETNAPIILETDIWEYTQPPWIYPMADEKATALKRMGFKLKQTITHPNASDQNGQPVVWIFQK